LILAAAVGAYYFMYEADRDPMADTARDQVFDVEPGAIEEVEVRAESGEATTARKTDGTWSIVSPSVMDADTAAINSLVSTLESLEVQHTVDEAPASLAPYGLDPPRFSLAFRVAGESAMRRLEVGNTTPTGGDLYAHVEGEPALFLISGYLADTLNRSTFELRDKTVLHLSRDVDRVRIETPDAPPIEAVRTDNDWRLTAPFDARADFSAIDGLISAVLQAQMSSIVAEAADDLSAYGLDQPRATAVLSTGSDQATLAIGGEIDDTTVYARDSSRPLVFTLDAAILEDLAPDPTDLRMQDLFLFRAFNANGLTVTVDGTTHTFAKQTPTPAEGEAADANPAPVWVRTAPSTGDVDQATMSGLLTSLSGLRAEAFAANALTTGEEVVVTVRFGSDDDPSEETVTFRKAGDVVHAVVEGEPGAAIVPTTAFDGAVAVIRQLTEGQ
jgi:hypothetical protein